MGKYSNYLFDLFSSCSIECVTSNEVDSPDDLQCNDSAYSRVCRFLLVNLLKTSFRKTFYPTDSN